LKMRYSSGQLNIGDSPPTCNWPQFLLSAPMRFEMSLLIETALVMSAAILVIRVLTTSSIVGSSWLVAPGILVSAALIPPAIKRREFAAIHLDVQQVRCTLMVVCCTCVTAFPAMFFGLWLLKYYGFQLPLQAMLPQGQGWIGWLFYQFFYVAVAEEVFFRGYLQVNIQRIAGKVVARQGHLNMWMSIGISAACFAAAHMIIQGKIILALTFLPGLILGWLFARTGSLLAPILFHGLANTCFCIVVAAFP